MGTCSNSFSVPFAQLKLYLDLSNFSDSFFSEKQNLEDQKRFISLTKKIGLMQMV